MPDSRPGKRVLWKVGKFRRFSPKRLDSARFREPLATKRVEKVVKSVCILAAILSPEPDQCLLCPTDPSATSPRFTASISLRHACRTAMVRTGLTPFTGVPQPIVTGFASSS